MLLDEVGPCDSTRLVHEAQRRWPGMTAHRLRSIVAAAITAGLVRDVGGVLHRLGGVKGSDKQGHEGTDADEQRSGPVRAVVVDVEAVVRPNTEQPYVDRRIYQIGAMRLSADVNWVAANPRFEVWVRLPDAGWEGELRSAAVRNRYSAAAVDPLEALTDLRGYLAEADIVVAYNGVAADFPILDDAAARVEQPPLGGVRRVDALYVAHVVWPQEGSHRLAELADAVGVDREGLQWHSAVDDAELTARLLRHAAATVHQWSGPQRQLLCGVGAGSAAWDLLTSLLPTPPPPAVTDDATVAWTLAEALQDDPRPAPGYQPVRRGRTIPTLGIPSALRTSGGMVDPYALVQAAAHGVVERRAAQQQMAQVLAAQIAAGRDALCEAPTGTGKSFAMLATALDWLAADPRHRVVIATYTKALQSQLAADIDRLAAVVPGLVGVADLVKGAPNRLSLRGLVAGLADAGAVVAVGQSRSRAAGRTRFAADPGYREVLAYLARRLMTARSAPQCWLARSVDPVDVPVFLAEYVEATRGRLLAVWLRSLSQEADDYAENSDSPLASMTDTVTEALATHRLVIANHALLMSRPEVFGERTLLVIDEAHALEQAVTTAASAQVEYRLVENLVGDLRRWFAEQANAPVSLDERIGELEAQLDTESLPRAAQAVFDAVGGQPGTRAATVASPFGGLGGDAPARHLLSRLMSLSTVAEVVHRQLAGYLASPLMRTAPWWERERAWSLASRVAGLVDAAVRIVEDARAMLDPPPTGSTVPAGPPDDLDSSVNSNKISSDELDGEHPEPVAAADEALGDDDLDHADVPDQVPVVDELNRVVYAIEHDLAGISASARRYGFSISSAPIDLARDPHWLATRGRFSRIFYVSATLQVAGAWSYIRGRLGLGAEVDAHALAGPFDLARQARLVCFTDFPSWAEQADGAVRTVAHQLAGYAREVVRPDHDGSDTGGGYSGGALVLTTATRAAAAITQRLQIELPTSAPGVPIASAPILGNARAARAFTEAGGFCVATRGMWQGVDFPADRLSLVWINKLPFAPFADPVTASRRAAVAQRAADAGHPDPDRVATERYYLPLAAMDLRQAVGRLVRSQEHCGVVIISDRKLAGLTALRRTYRRVFLESLDQGLLVADPDTGEVAGGNVMSMADGWARIWHFLAANGRLTAERAQALCQPTALEQHTLLPATRKIMQARIAPDEEASARAAGTLADLLVHRCAKIGGHLRFSDSPLPLRPQQEEVIRAVATDQDVLALLPTGFGKSYTFQLPALALPGVTVVISPLVALMADQALELNASVGGAVRALVGPMAESNSRRGKTEVAEQLTGACDHGIKIVYVSPERLGNRRFQELLRTAAAAGILRRVAVDEAHTFVQWGDDFRPSFRRAAQLLAELRARHGVRVTAVTATANRAVRTGLRVGLFGLPASPTAGESLRTVTADPLRPELAIYRRTLRAAGPNTVAGLTEAIASACNDHAIFYCLTVKEVDAVYAHLHAFIGADETRRVRRFHGRLSEAEKAAVLTEFRESPAQGEEGYVPLLIVATSAFGLGVNRRDIRCVFVVSPPTDLAALYQQLGRAGRDQAGVDPSQVTAPSYGLALGTGRGFRTVAWMATQGLNGATLCQIGEAVLTAARTGGVLDPDKVADHCIGADLACGRLARDAARRPATVAQYRATVIRALAALSDAGTVDDGGDFPATVVITPIDTPARCDAHTLTATATALIRLASARPGRHRIVDLHRRLTTHVPGYRLVADDPAQTWAVLATLHDFGVIDVSQAGNHRTLAAIGPRRSAARLPADFLPRMTTHRTRLMDDLSELRAWYTSAECVNTGFAAYFAATATLALPAGTCTTPACRCSACWTTNNDMTTTPPLLAALNTPRPRPSARRDATPYREAVERYVRSLLWDNYRGLTAVMLHRVLRGDETYLSARTGRRRPLWPRLLYHRLRGVDPGITVTHVEEAIGRLATRNEVISADGRVWRLRRHVEREAVRTARADAVQGVVR